MEPEFTDVVGRVRPRSRVAVVYDGGEAAGFLPHERGPLGQGRAIGLGVSDCQGAVLRQDLAPDTRRLLRACSLSSFAFDNLEAEQGLFVPHAAEEHTTYVIDVEQGYEAYEKVLRARSPKFLKTTLAKERRLGRQVGDVRFVFDERDPAALRTLMAWKSAQYRRTGRRDRFAQEWITRLVGRLAGTRAPECTGTLSVLYAGGRPLAAHFGLRSTTVLACWFPAYDPDFAKYSPGLILHLRMAEAAAAEGIGMLDMGRGPAEYKDSLKTGELPVYEGAATRPGRAPRCSGSAANRCAARTASCARGRGWRRWRYGHCGARPGCAGPDDGHHGGQPRGVGAWPVGGVRGTRHGGRSSSS